MDDELQKAFSRLEDLVKGARRELSTGYLNNAVALIENAALTAQTIRRLIYIEIDKREAALANPKAANDRDKDPGVPPKEGN